MITQTHTVPDLVQPYQKLQRGFSVRPEAIRMIEEYKKYKENYARNMKFDPSYPGLSMCEKLRGVTITSPSKMEERRNPLCG